MVAEQVQRELVDHALVLGDELRAGVFVAGRTALDEGGFPAPDVRPCDGGNGLHSESFRHLTTLAPVGKPALSEA